MGATFPNGIATFSPKRNLLDDVDANDINKMQDEIVAIQAVLGPLLNEVDDIQADVNQNDTADQAALKSIRTSFKSLSDQLAALRAGTHIPVFQTLLQNVNIPGEPSYKPWRVLRYPKPAVDSHKGYNGYGWVAPRTGFYLIRAQVNFDSGPGPQALGFGTYTAVIDVGGTIAGAMDRKEHDGGPALGVHLDPFYLGWVKRGSRIQVKVNQDSNRTSRMYSSFFSAAMIRDMEPLLVNLGFEGPLPGSSF